jgi:hypothetical protein
MSQPPAKPKIYHITHVDNLPGIIADGGLVSDATMIARGGPASTIGMSGIKKRRVEELEVSCHRGSKVGDYVPFYFCPRSVMLFVLHRANHPELTYRGGQDPIVHLEADLRQVIQWADEQGRPWAFSLSNASAAYATFRNRVEHLNQLNWAAIAATDFRLADIKEGKQAEFLVLGDFQWELITRIGVRSAGIQSRVLRALPAQHRLPVEVQQDWYY